MRTLCLTAALFCLPLFAAEPAGPFPLWDGKTDYPKSSRN